MKDKKNSGFYMRASQLDKKEISKLAQRLHCSESEAIRRSVAFMLEVTKTTRFPKERIINVRIIDEGEK